MSSTGLQPAPRLDPAPTSRPRTVLVVDDDADIRDAIAELLLQQGLHVRTAGGGTEALGILGEEPPPDAIVLDLMMPLVSGLHVLAAMACREDLRRVPRVIVSAMPVPTHVSADPRIWLLPKPFDGDRLVAVIREVLEYAPQR